MYNYQNPYMQYVPQMQNQYQNQYMNINRQQVIRVNGMEGAKAYQMLPPNSSALLLDENEPILYLAQTDGAGYKTITPYKIEPYKEEQKKDNLNLEERIRKLEEMVYNVRESNNSNAYKKQKTESDTAGVRFIPGEQSTADAE